MKLREWDWDKQGYVEVDYAELPIVEFLNWMRQTKAWHEDLELVHRRLRHLNAMLSKDRQAQREAIVEVLRETSPAEAPRTKARAVKATKRSVAVNVED